MTVHCHQSVLLLMMHGLGLAEEVPVLGRKWGMLVYGTSSRGSGSTESAILPRPEPHIMPMMGLCRLRGSLACKYCKASAACSEIVKSITDDENAEILQVWSDLTSPKIDVRKQCLPS